MYDRHSTYLTWGGTIGTSGEDRWQCGVHLALSPSLDGPGLPETTELQTLLDGPLATFHSAADSWISPGARLSWAKAASLDPAGEYSAEPVSVSRAAVPGGSSATLRGGPQMAACITLWSGLSLGKANYGRFYVPWWEGQCEDSGHVNSTIRNAMATNATTLVNAINSWAASSLSATARIMIMSAEGTGSSKRALWLKVGDVKDTQQRRRRQLAESYTVVELA